MTVPMSYTARVQAELKHDVKIMNAKNMNLPVYTRQMTKEEIEQIFGDNPDAIKNIGMSVDTHEWRRIK